MEHHSEEYVLEVPSPSRLKLVADKATQADFDRPVAVVLPVRRKVAVPLVVPDDPPVDGPNVSSGPSSSYTRRVLPPSVGRGTTSPEVIDLTLEDSSASVEVEAPRPPVRIGRGRGLLGRLVAAMDSSSNSSDGAGFPRFFGRGSGRLGGFDGGRESDLDPRPGPSGYVAPAVGAAVGASAGDNEATDSEASADATEAAVSLLQGRPSVFLPSNFVSPFASPFYSPASTISSVASSPVPPDPLPGEEYYNWRLHWSPYPGPATSPNYDVEIPALVMASPYSDIWPDFESSESDASEFRDDISESLSPLMFSESSSDSVHSESTIELFPREE